MVVRTPAAQTKPLPPLALSILSLGVGVVAGLGAVAFRDLIAFFHNLLLLGKLSFVYDANVHTPVSSWGPLVILVPVLGAVGVTFLVKNFAPEAKGHGVPEVMDAVYYNKGIIRPVVAVVKSLASALSIGSGGSIGREGPIIQIGSSFGSSVAQLLRLPPWQRVTLIAGGAGAGIAATFNTPVGGLLFAIEIMMHEVSVRTLVPVVVATATATYVGRIFFGPHPSFVIPQFEMPYFHLTQPLVLLAYVGLGHITGIISTVFIKCLYGFEDFFEKRVKGGYYVQHMLGMLLVGILMYVMMTGFGHYYIEGVGYSTIQDVLSGTQAGLLLLLLLLVLKLVATSLTLGSGASGGIFSPSLFIGATLGGAYGVLLRQIFPGLQVSPSAFAVAGMAGMVGGVTGAAVTAIVMIFEMTLNYSVIIPMTITVAISYGLRKVLSSESIYTLKLVRRGHFMPDALQANLPFLRQARDLMDTHFRTVPASTTVDELVREILPKHEAITSFLVEANNGVIGFLTRDSALAALGQSETARASSVGEIARHDCLTVTEDATVMQVLYRMRTNRAFVALVANKEGAVGADAVEGLITKDRLTDYMAESTELFSE
jgi:CIC family chloride channel protein